MSSPRLHSLLPFPSLLAGGLLLLGGCDPEGPDPVSVTAGLTHVSTCPDLREAIHRDARTRVRLEADEYRRQVEYWDAYGEGKGVATSGGGGVGAEPPRAAGGEESANDAGDASGPDSFSETNNQVSGVDEADFVKTDGKRIYVLARGKLYILDSWPAEDLALAKSIDIEGYPVEMFVQDNQAIVYSTVQGSEDFGLTDQCAGDGETKPGAPEPGPAPDRDFGDDEGYYGGCFESLTKVSLVDFSGKEPKETRSRYYQGSYLSGRLHGKHARAIVQSSIRQPASIPSFYEYADSAFQGDPDRIPESERRRVALDLISQWESAAKKAIGKTTLEDWLPIQGEMKDGKFAIAELDCDTFLVPSAGLVEYGLTTIAGASFDSADDEVDTSILGSASQVYANAEVLVLGHPDWSWYLRQAEGDQTALHRFTLDDKSTAVSYVGSGFVPGYVHNQFSLDEKDGVIRVSTTQNRSSSTSGGGGSTGGAEPAVWSGDGTINLVTTLGVEDDALVILGQTEPLAPGERIFSTRYIDDLAYVVTFRQVDPLFAIDLSDPAAPKVLGELKIPGFSDYMHPIGKDHLLTIGRDGTEDGQVRGLALQIFDVSKPTKPKLSHKYVFGEDGYSEANYNHKAFTYFAEKKLLAFPYQSYYPEFDSTLEVFDVDVDAGFARRGAASHKDLLKNQCDDIPVAEDPWSDAGWACEVRPNVRRGVFIEDYIYSISDAGVLVHDVDDLSTDPLGTVEF
ncbi:MAG: beta-propeller domain-containing protein [Myxococcales bacterium]|nr:beta-propeller domain-containing protein [Myxococcales bacterium]